VKATLPCKEVVPSLATGPPVPLTMEEDTPQVPLMLRACMGTMVSPMVAFGLSSVRPAASRAQVYPPVAAALTPCQGSTRPTRVTAFERTCPT